MSKEQMRQLDAEALALFAAKGREGGPGVPQAGLANGVKLRRVMQLTADLAGKPFGDLRILDLGCGEGAYAIEAALRGATVLALDARTVRMERGAAIAARLGLDRLQFVQDDVRRATRERLGRFDVVYMLGILYHLDVPDVFAALEAINRLCDRLLIVDTLVSQAPGIRVSWRGCDYRGEQCREHGDCDTVAERSGRPLKSIDNTFSFRFALADLVRALRAAGFASVLEAHAPLEPGKAGDRVTLAAVQGEPVHVATYPWVNERSEAGIAAFLGAGATLRAEWRPGEPVRPLTQAHLAGEELELGLHGPGAAGLKRSHHADVAGDPWYLWSGGAAGPWAVTFRPRSGPVPVGAGACLRWRSRQSGTNRLRPIAATADGRWYIAEPGTAASADWCVDELAIVHADWRPLDLARLCVGATVTPAPWGSAGSVAAVGVADLEPGAGSERCARLDWLELHAGRT
jgi:SAM-dependent methyltransferase